MAVRQLRVNVTHRNDCTQETPSNGGHVYIKRPDAAHVLGTVTSAVVVVICLLRLTVVVGTVTRY